jgi:hypothetical protein
MVAMRATDRHAGELATLVGGEAWPVDVAKVADASRDPERQVALSIPHGRTSRRYRWVCGSRTPIADVLDREFLRPRMLGARAAKDA